MLVLSPLHIVFGILESFHQSAISSSDSAPCNHNVPDVPTPVQFVMQYASVHQRRRQNKRRSTKVDVYVDSRNTITALVRENDSSCKVHTIWQLHLHALQLQN